MYAKAESHLRRAVARVSASYTRPGSAEALYHLGVALRGQDRLGEAYDMFYRATWDYAFYSAAYYQLAELSCRQGDYRAALEQVDKSLSTNVRNKKALNLKATLLRRRGDIRGAQALARSVLAEDPLDFLAMNELYLTYKGRRAARLLAEQEGKMRQDVQSYLELASDYMSWGLPAEAIAVLGRAGRGKTAAMGTYPLVYYYLGYLHQQTGQEAAAKRLFALAAKMPIDYCFPHRAESIEILTAATEQNADDARAHYYLRNALYEIQPERAIGHWERAVRIDGAFARAHRNLGWAQYRTRHNIPDAIASYEKAIAGDSSDARVFTELDRLYELGNVEPLQRLAMLETHHGQSSSAMTALSERSWSWSWKVGTTRPSTSWRPGTSTYERAVAGFTASTWTPICCGD